MGSGASNSGNGDGDDDDAAFRAAMNDVRPLGNRGTPKLRTPARRPRRRSTAPPPKFTIEQGDGWIHGRRSGVSLEQLAVLRRGEHGVDARIDLHGHREHTARATLLDHIDRARAGGARCVLVIHGRGRHSPGGPVLPALVRDVLSSGAARGVTAFCTALPRDGGSGAMYVLLARK